MLNYYRILDVPQSASVNDIKRAYRSKVLRWHPDKNPDNRKEAEQKFKEIVEAYKVLSEKSTRDHYDENNKDAFKETKKPKDEKNLSVFDQDGIKIFFTGQRSSSDFSVSFFSAPKRFHHFSIMTAFINGKKITTKRHLENESKYLEVEEDGKTVSIHVNGIPVYDREFNGPSGSWHWNCRLDKARYRPDRWRFWTCERLRWAEEWRRWANKWRDWAEECRDWAEGRQNTKVQDNARHHQANAKEHPKASQEHFRSDRCPRTGGKISGFSMPGEEKCDSKEGNGKTNKGPTRPEEENSNLNKGYFVFPKPGERTSEMDEGHPRTSKRQHKPEEGNLSPNVGVIKPREGPTRQEEGHHRIKTGKPKPDDGQARPGKVHLGLQKSDQISGSRNPEPMENEIPRQHSISECSSQAEINESLTEEEELPSEENNTHAMKCENLDKKAPKFEKLETEGQKGSSTLMSEPVKEVELNCQMKKNFVGPKVTPKTLGSRGLPLKRKEPQIRTRKLYSKRSKSQARMKRRNKSQAGKHRTPDGHSRQELAEKVFLNEGRQMTPDGKMSPADSKCDLPNREKGPLPPLQKGDNSLQTRKRLLRRRVHHPFSETQNERLHSISETNQLLNIHGQQQRKLKKLPQASEQLPSIQGQKLGKNKQLIVNS